MTTFTEEKDDMKKLFTDTFNLPFEILSQKKYFEGLRWETNYVTEDNCTHYIDKKTKCEYMYNGNKHIWTKKEINKNIENDLKYMRNILETQYPIGEYEDGDIWQKIRSLEDIDTYPCMDIDLDLHPEFPDNMYSLFFLGDSSYFPGFYDASMIYIVDLECTIEEDDPNKVFFDDENYYIRSPIGDFNFYIKTILTDFLNIYTEDDEYKKTALLILEKLDDNYICK